jgi:hypothetical protein
LRALARKFENALRKAECPACRSAGTELEKGLWQILYESVNDPRTRRRFIEAEACAAGTQS